MKVLISFGSDSKDFQFFPGCNKKSLRNFKSGDTTSLFFLDTGCHYVVQAGLELAMLSQAASNL
jgi:hypothetical protein